MPGTAVSALADALACMGARTLVLTGAGISLASGIPTFRGTDEGAVWAAELMERATLRHFLIDPMDTWRWYRQRLGQVLAAAPNPAHDAVVRLEAWAGRHGAALHLVTQNIDRLHERAGSRSLIKVHGSIDQARCTGPDCRSAATATVPVAELDFARFDVDPSAAAIPRCPACGHLMRPHVLWFDERYGSHPAYGWEAVLAACEAMSLAIAVGTSFSVGVTEMVSHEAARRRVPLFIVDPAATSIRTGRLTVHLREKAEEILPAVCERLQA